MRDWKFMTVEDCIESSPFGAQYVATRQYQTAGQYPVVDQGEGLIAGWTDDATKLVDEGLPVIVYGDHTRRLKYVDFPFVRGAQGTQVLRPREGIQPLFFYFACRSLQLPSRGYNRHFRMLRESVVPIASADEQDKISRVLHVAERSVEQQEALLTILVRLRNEVSRMIFPRRHNAHVPTEGDAPSIPRSWTMAPLEECALVQTGVAKGRKLSEEEMVNVPYLRVANVQDGHLDLNELKTIAVRESEIERYRLHDGDVVLTEGGDFDKLGRGVIWRGEIETCIHQNQVFAVRAMRDRLLPDFFAYQVQSPYGKAYFLKVAHKTTNLACINTTKLKAFPVLLPSMEEQQEIVEILSAIDASIDHYRRKHTVLQDLFVSILQKLMTGEIRVDDLDLSALSEQPTEAAA